MFAPSFVASTGLPGLPSLGSLQKAFVIPSSVVPLETNITSRITPGWTYNPLGNNIPERGYLGNGGGSAL